MTDIAEAPASSHHRSPSTFEAWVDYFTRNTARQRAIEAEVDWAAPRTLPQSVRLAVGRSFQRFELGESGEGEHLLGLAERAGDPAYTEALRLLITEEQRHSALFGRGLAHLGVPPLRAHWSDRAFTALRRSLGLDTEIALFLVAETVALDWFIALAEAGGDEVLRGIGRRITTDEREHVRFQVDRLHHDLRGLPRAERLLVGVVWHVVALGAATVLAVGHAPALRACGRTPLQVWTRGLRTFRRAAAEVLHGDPLRESGPAVPRPDLEASTAPIA